MKERLTPAADFLLHFNKLREEVNGSPQTLLTFLKEKPEWRGLASNVRASADFIKSITALKKVHPHVSPSFINAWKEYERIWKIPVEYVYWEKLFSLSLDVGDGTIIGPISYEEFAARDRAGSTLEAPNPETDERFKPLEHDGGAAIRSLKSVVSGVADGKREIGEYFIANALDVGLGALDHLEDRIGIDLALAFDRWSRLPPVFVPKHVSDRHGQTEKGSLYELLNDAIRAYVAGAPAAAIAMCRACLEIVLKDHYLRGEWDEKDSLYSVIELAVVRYDFLSKKKLHSLRLDANRILHNIAGEPKLGLEDEKVLLQFFKDLKFYIERAPQKPASRQGGP
ncbi:hypothetical protein ACLB6G_04415 [Zhengella sp. ZM62]|uniref:hypothetical protein n=1 Tax=Zhengella sedimenti TaxID=3390035 RepID=UPI003976E6FA